MRLELKLFYDALCNGLSELYHYGIICEPNYEHYNKAKSKLSNRCSEDVYIQILEDGNTLSFIDEEGEGCYSVDVTIDMVIERVFNTPQENLLALIKEYGDACDADVLLQTVLYNKIIFG